MTAQTWNEYVAATAALLDEVDPGEVQALVDAIVDAYRADAFVFIIGNGGSAASASHLCEDLGKGTLTDLERQRRLRAISLTDSMPYILAWANDEGYERIFVEQLRNLARPGALLIAISGSGNSPNVLRAVEYGNEHGMRTFGVCGYDGGALKRAAQQSLHVRSDDMGMVEAVHGVVFHYLVDALRAAFAEAGA
ncbi:MAG TPA: SIS domain-containing protein [Anaerolineae bacterium]|nr:SIS domain-containing protein [Anaerolineae bacterium]